MAKTYKNIEKEIRKDTHRNNFFKIIEEDINDIVNPYRKEFININCPNCDCNDTRQAFIKGQFSYYNCSVCDTLFVNPRPPQHVIDRFYLVSKAVAASTQSLMDNEAGRKKHIFIPRTKLILKVLKEMKRQTGKLLEVGCSIGTFLDIIKDESDFCVEGIDPSQKACATALSRGLKVYQTTLENFKPPKSKYDVVLNFETIEHILSPYNFLIKINNLLKKGGYVVFTTPNYHGFDMMVLGKYYKNIHAPCHLNYFNVDTINKLLARTGFEAVKKMTPGVLDIEITREQISENVAGEVSPFIKHLIFNTNGTTQESFQKFLRDNCLSGNMLIFAQKIKNTEE